MAMNRLVNLLLLQALRRRHKQVSVQTEHVPRGFVLKMFGLSFKMVCPAHNSGPTVQLTVQCLATAPIRPSSPDSSTAQKCGPPMNNGTDEVCPSIAPVAQ